MLDKISTDDSRVDTWITEGFFPLKIKFINNNTTKLLLPETS